MKLFKRILPLFLFAFLCFSCSQKPARIVNNGGNFYSKNSSYNKDKYRNLNKAKSLKSNQIEVVSGDTLFGISRKYQAPLRDLIEKNNLTPPYNLFAGSVLTLPTPSYHEVQSGETIVSIARRYQMNVDTIVALNDLKAPYQLKNGQRIRISNSQNKAGSELAVAKKTEFKQLDSQKLTSQKLNSQSPNSKSEFKENDAPSFVEKTLDKFNHFSKPVNGKVVSKFGPKSGGLYNDGINISAPVGTKVKASEDGVVAYVGNELKGYGNLVIVKHSGGWITAYAHLSKALVKKGQKVKKLDAIAEVGSTGNVSSPQLYFGLRKGRDAVNPENYLRK